MGDYLSVKGRQPGICPTPRPSPLSKDKTKEKKPLYFIFIHLLAKATTVLVHSIVVLTETFYSYKILTSLFHFDFLI